MKDSYSADFNGGGAQCNAVTQSQLMMNNLSFTTSLVERQQVLKEYAYVNLITADWLISAVRIHQQVMRTADYDHKEGGGRDREREERSCP